MTKKDFYSIYWPKIQGQEVDIKCGYKPIWFKNAIIESIIDKKTTVYLIYRKNHYGGTASIRSIKAIATSTETDLK